MFRLLYFFLLFLLAPKTLNAASKADTVQSVVETDSVAVSLLTCSPGSQVYELYGHTAIRVKEIRDGRSSDWVFNYGTFSFNQPNFTRRFVMGETDYELSVLPYYIFYQSYASEGRAVYEQRLNFSPEEQRAITDALSRNLLPENAVYRYNFFYDNCTTRALDRITEAVKGKIAWKAVAEEKSLRDVLHEFAAVSPWYSFGQDLLLGAEADRPADRRLQSFAPLYAMAFVEKAVIESEDGKVRPLSQPTKTLLPATAPKSSSIFISPMGMFGILLALTLAITFAEWRRKKNYWAFDVLLLVAQGLTGLLVCFLFFFSAHPAVGSNYLIAMFNPLPLLYFPWFMKHAAAGRKDRAMFVQCLMLLLTLVFGLTGLQVFPPALYLIIATLTLRAIWHLTRPVTNILSSSK